MKVAQPITSDSADESKIKLIESEYNNQEIFEFAPDRKIKEFKFTAYREHASPLEERRKSKKTLVASKSNIVRNTNTIGFFGILTSGIVTSLAFLARVITLFCLVIITVCAVAFIYFEYKPDTSLAISPIDTRAAAVDARCLSADYTDLYKRRFLNCK
jgi:hypothetical protein